MAKLPKFTLTHNEKKDRWDLTKDDASRPAASFDTKSDATKGGALEKAVCKDGGSVKIQKVDGPFQEERTYPSCCRSQEIVSCRRMSIAPFDKTED